MEIKELQKLLETPEVKEALESSLNEAVSAKQAELDSKIATLEEDKKKMKKQLFLVKKTLAAKANLYEGKLKQYYEAKFEAATKKVADSVYDFINESVASLVKTIQEDVTANSKEKRLEEAVSQALRALSPHANIAELSAASNENIEKLKNQLNNVIKENKLLKSKTLSEELDALVVSECAGYPLDRVVLIRETLKKVDPQPTTLVEAKNVISKIKEAARKTSTPTQTVSIPKPVVEAKETVKIETSTNARVALHKVVEEQKAVKPVENKREPVSALAYDIADV